jgi:hypothetical protein
LARLRRADRDSDHEVIVVPAGEGSQEGTLVYDPYAKIWTNRHAPDQRAFRSGGNMVYDSIRKMHILFGSRPITVRTPGRKLLKRASRTDA